MNKVNWKAMIDQKQKALDEVEKFLNEHIDDLPDAVYSVLLDGIVENKITIGQYYKFIEMDEHATKHERKNR